MKFSTNPTAELKPEIPLLHRQDLQLKPDAARVVVRPFKPATEPRDMNAKDRSRANLIADRVLGLSHDVAKSQLAEVLESFEGRHRNLLRTFEARYVEMEEALEPHDTFTPIQRQLVGAYFLNEYSFEAAALFNPSIVA
ncbi:MAG: glycosidase, partial [Aestuariivirga sp.]